MKAVTTFLFGAIILPVMMALASATNGSLASGTDTLVSSVAGEPAAANQIVFAGRLTDRNSGKWLDDYYVIVYKNGKEISRTITRQGKFEPSGLGVHNGLFTLTFPNEYELTTDTGFMNQGQSLSLAQATTADWLGSTSTLYRWFGDVHPGDQIKIEVPGKQLTYTVAVWPVSRAETSEQLFYSQTTITAEGVIMFNKQTVATTSTTIAGTSMGMGGAVPEAADEYPLRNKSIRWGRPFTPSTTLNRAQVWNLYINNQVPGLTWDQFMNDVLAYNPQLGITFTFEPDHNYILPYPTES